VLVRPVRSLWNCARALAGGVPLQALFCHSPAAQRLLRRELTAGPPGTPPAPFDVLHVEHLRAAAYGFPAHGIARVFDSVDCISRLLSEAASHGSAPLTRLIARFDLGRTRRFERRLVGHFDRVLVSSEGERGHFDELLGDAEGSSVAMEVLPNGVDLDYFRPRAAPRDEASLIFVGRMGYHANTAAAHYLLGEIMPRLWAERPEVRLTIVGEGPPASLRALVERQSGRVVLTGYVEDVRPYLARAAVSVNPLVYAVGIQNKVLEAMAMETPVVASPVASAALRARADEHLLVARDPAQYVAAVVRLLDDAQLRRRIGVAGREYVSSHHDWDVVASRLELLYGEQVKNHAGRIPGWGPTSGWRVL
jgi:glycosyltransferase involved in cell wall biosynthesis